MSARNNGGFATTVNVVLGGLNGHGENSVNELTYLCLEAEEAVFNSEPNTSIRVSKRIRISSLRKLSKFWYIKKAGSFHF
ncbi:hypothetical protein GTU79_27370 [Sodalis ligni]|nr:hypothetical protein GTU79_27370 [Sodalis ligni]